jgi:peptidoglycan/xylan/chitin deacetylase (PgdA/CDA1 family)
VKRIVKEGHEIGNHSWSHRQLTYLSDEEITDQIMMTRAKIYDTVGVDSLIVRPPYGACNDTVKAVGKKVGVSFVNWSVDTLDWKNKNAKAVRNEIMNSIFDGAIILCHDLHKTTVDAMEIVVPELIEKGYQLVTVSELMEYSEGTLVAGKVYYRQ